MVTVDLHASVSVVGLNVVARRPAHSAGGQLGERRNKSTNYNNDTSRNTADTNTHRASYLHVGVSMVGLNVM